MTAITVFMQKERAIALSDALFISCETGLPVGFADKSVAVNGQRTVVLSRGDYRVPHGVAGMLPRFYDNIDEVIEGEASHIASAYEDWVEEAGIADGAVNGVQIFFAGWSDEQDAPRGAFLSRENDEWTFGELGEEGVSAPLLNDQELVRLGTIGVEPGEDWDADSFDPIRHGLPYLEAQRRMKLPMPHMKRRDRIHTVGGYVLLTEVTRDGVRQEIIHRWEEDQVGTPIAAAPFATPLRAGASRQERRAYERQMRKAA